MLRQLIVLMLGITLLSACGGGGVEVGGEKEARAGFPDLGKRSICRST
jgi:hypothetical protein